FLETVTRLIPMYWMRAVGGALYITGLGIGVYNIIRTWQTRPAKYDEPDVSVPPMIRATKAIAKEQKILERATDAKVHWHRKWEGLPALFTVLVAVAVIVAS